MAKAGRAERPARLLGINQLPIRFTPYSIRKLAQDGGHCMAAYSRQGMVHRVERFPDLEIRVKRQQEIIDDKVRYALPLGAHVQLAHTLFAQDVERFFNAVPFESGIRWVLEFTVSIRYGLKINYT